MKSPNKNPGEGDEVRVSRFWGLGFWGVGFKVQGLSSRDSQPPVTVSNPKTLNPLWVGWGLTTSFGGGGGGRG